MKKFLSWMMNIAMAVMVVFGTSALTSCGNDDDIEEALEDKLELKFNVGDLTENEDGTCVLSASSVEIHYAGKIGYDAGIVISTVKDFDPELGGHMAMTHHTHSASNHASSTTCGLGSIKVTFPEDFSKTVYYSIFIMTDDGKYFYGPVKSFERSK